MEKINYQQIELTTQIATILLKVKKKRKKLFAEKVGRQIALGMKNIHEDFFIYSQEHINLFPNMFSFCFFIIS